MNKLINMTLRVAALVFSIMAPVHAQFVAGQIVDDQGQGIVGVALEFSGGVTPAGAESGIGGFFNVAVPTDTYDLGLAPPVDTLAPKMLLSVAVLGSTNLGVITLERGFLLTGMVQTSTGVPVNSGNIDVIDYHSGEVLFTPGDGIDFTGSFDVVVPAGTYRVRAKPSGGVLLVSREVAPVVINAPMVMSAITLPPGFLVTGRVIDSVTLLPLADVDLDVDDVRTGKRLFTPRDNTNSSGQFSLVLPRGHFDISLDPPKGSRHVGRKFSNVLISGPTAFGSVTLQQGVFLSGSLFGPGSTPVFRSDIDLLSVPGGQSLAISNDNTDANGDFTIAVRPGRYRLRFEPRLNDRLLSAVTASFDVFADMTHPSVQLSAGVLLSGSLRAFDGLAEGSADIDLIDPVSGDEVLLSRDNTNETGNYAFIAPPGVWDLRFQTEKASPSRTQTLPGTVIATDTVVDHSLSLVPVFVYLNKPGWLTTVFQGGLLPSVIGIVNLTRSIVSSDVSLVLVDPDGMETSLLPPTLLFIPTEDDLPADPRAIDESMQLRLFLVRLPLVNPSHLGQTFRLELRLDDPETGEEFDQDSIKVIIQ